MVVFKKILFLETLLNVPPFINFHFNDFLMASAGQYKRNINIPVREFNFKLKFFNFRMLSSKRFQWRWRNLASGERRRNVG
jgi:hypothetical protein